MTPGEALDALRSDPTQRAVVKAARSWGVAPTTFMGRGPRLALVVSGRDQAGRPVRYVDARPEWTDDDRALALALEAYEAEVCSGCGYPLDETTDPLNEGRYVAAQPVRCHACMAHSQASTVYGENDPHPSALRIAVEFRPPTPIDAALEQEAVGP